MKEVKVVYALVQNDCGQVLMVYNHEGHWSLPGGRVEADETLLEAVAREAYEETGLTINAGKLLAVNEGKFLKRGHHALFFTFLATITGGVEKITHPEEIFHIQWVDIQKAEQRMPFFPEGIDQLIRGHAFYHDQGTV